jgi:hypothetical protein
LLLQINLPPQLASLVQSALQEGASQWVPLKQSLSAEHEVLHDILSELQTKPLQSLAVGVEQDPLPSHVEAP